MNRFWLKALFFVAVTLLTGCCYTAKPPDPDVENPLHYDQIKVRQLGHQDNMRLLEYQRCMDPTRPNQSGKPFPMVITKGNENYDTACLSIFDGTVAFDSFTLVRANLGYATYTVSASMNYKVFISHREKQVLIKSTVTESGSCGSSNSYFIYDRLFLIPRIPEGYSIEIDINHQDRG